MSSRFQDCQPASVTRPDTLANTFGNDDSSRNPRAHNSMAPLLIAGFARWSTTKRWRRTQSEAADDAKNEGIVRGEFQQPARFLQRLPNLDENASLKGIRFHLRL